MYKRKNLRPIFIIPPAILLIFLLIFLLSDLIRYSKSFCGINSDDETVFFDSQIRDIVSEVDRKLAREGYNIVSRAVDSHKDHGGIEMMAYNGVDMRLVKLTTNYARQVQVISHEKTAYQKFVSGLENIIGRLPEVFYTLDRTEYIGPREEKSETATVECCFMLVKDNKDRFLGGDYYTYACTMARKDMSLHSFYDETGFLISEYENSSMRESRNFGGDLEWLKSKAYNNYVSRMVVDSAFEWYE